MVVVVFEDGAHRYGLFNLWADSQTQGNKRVHSLVSGLPSGDVRIESFTMGSRVQHVIYDSQNRARYMTTLAKEPLIRLDIHEVPTNTEINGTIDVFLRNQDGSGAKVFNKMTLRRMDTSVSVSTDANKKNPTNSNFSLEEYSTINGHVFNATLQDDRTDKSSKVTLLQRAHQYTFFNPPATEQVLFQHIEAHGEYTVALHMDPSSALFTIFTNNTVRKAQNYQPTGGLRAFDFGLVSEGRALIAYSSSFNSGDFVSLALIQQDHKISEQSTSSLSFTKLRFAQIDDRDNLVLFGLDADTRKMEVFLVKVVGQISTIERVFFFEDVTDFDVTDPGNKINLFFTNDEATKVQFKSWNKDSFRNGPTT